MISKFTVLGTFISPSEEINVISFSNNCNIELSISVSLALSDEIN